MRFEKEVRTDPGCYVCADSTISSDRHYSEKRQLFGNLQHPVSLPPLTLAIQQDPTATRQPQREEEDPHYASARSGHVIDWNVFVTPQKRARLIFENRCYNPSKDRLTGSNRESDVTCLTSRSLSINFHPTGIMFL